MTGGGGGGGGGGECLVKYRVPVIMHRMVVAFATSSCEFVFLPKIS